MNKCLLQFVSIMLMVSLMGFAWAGPEQDDEGRRGMHHGHSRMLHGGPNFDRIVEHMSRRLELDETQQQKIHNIVDAARPQAEALQEQAKANREAMHSLDSADPDYDVKLQNLAVKNGELVTQLTLLHGRVIADVHAELTDEQKAKMSQIRDRMSERRGGMHKQFRHHRPSAESMDDATS